jgi:hypothetical protein
VAKRSPILGYNHNVRYRGLIFHVQTEDSGVLSPHLFTHLFVGGVIVSTRKLVYDNGSAEDSIKSLMQAQHKAVLKDLKRGTFDDKIDVYLAGTPGLLPRGAVDPGADAPLPPATPVPIPVSAEPIEPIEPAGSTKPTKQVSPDPVERIEPERTIPEKRPSGAAPPQARTQTAERGSPAGSIRTTLGPPDPVDVPVDATTRTSIPANFHDSSPEIEIQLELDEDDDDPVLTEQPVPAAQAGRTPSGRSRMPRDTDIAPPSSSPSGMIGIALHDGQSDGVPGAMRSANESIPPLPPPPASSQARPGSALGAATLPAARPITRPPTGGARPAMTPPQVLSRPLAADDARKRSNESDAVEVYAPAPPSADVPPGMVAPDRPGEYSQHKKTQRVPTGLKAPNADRSGAIPIPPGLGRPGATRPPSATASPLTRPHARQSHETEPRPRTPTPTRALGTPSNSGVVMTRPAVIVGAPAKPATTTTQRVRKAREDEGRGFGQGLISEKSLDEVILAYLSEDADDK